MTAGEKMAFALSPDGQRAAREHLSRLRALDAMIALKLSQADDLREKSAHVTRAMGALPDGGQSDCEARLADLEREILSDYGNLLTQRQEIESTIRRVPNETQRMVLEMRYIEGMPFFRIAMALHYDERTIYRYHQKALSHAALYLLEMGQIAA